MRNILNWGTVVLLLVLPACEMFDYHPYDTDISGETNVNAHNIAEIEPACLDKDTLRFVVMGDSQRWYDETEDFVKHVNKRSDIDFVIHGGDISDFGATDEFTIQRDIMNKLDVPYVVLIGNHDYLGTGESTYAAVFGDTNFSFIAGRVKFVCIDTNALENDYTTPIPDFDFLQQEWTSRDEEFDRTIICMHVRPSCDEFNNNVANVFEYCVTQFRGLLFCTCAHEHSQFISEPFEDGVLYYVSDCMGNRSYYIFTITPEGYEYEVIYF